MKRIAEKASNRSKSSPKTKARPALTFEMARQLCPHDGLANNVAERFGPTLPEYDEIRIAQVTTLEQMAQAFQGSLNERATEMHFQRIVGAIVGSAIGAGNFYSERVKQAREATIRAADIDNEDAPYGLESKAQRARDFAADMAMQAYALLAAAHGAVEAYKSLTGQRLESLRSPGRS